METHSDVNFEFLILDIRQRIFNENVFFSDLSSALKNHRRNQTPTITLFVCRDVGTALKTDCDRIITRMDQRTAQDKVRFIATALTESCQSINLHERAYSSFNCNWERRRNEDVAMTQETMNILHTCPSVTIR